MNSTNNPSIYKAKTRKELLNYFKNLPEEYIMTICHELSCMKMSKKTPWAVYMRFLTLINDRYWIESALARKHRLAPKDIALANQIKIARAVSPPKVKNSPSYDIIRKRYIWLIHDLRMKGLSWRQLSRYLKLNHSVSISYTYLRSIYLEAYSKKTLSLHIPPCLTG